MILFLTFFSDNQPNVNKKGKHRKNREPAIPSAPDPEFGEPDQESSEPVDSSAQQEDTEAKPRENAGMLY